MSEEQMLKHALPEFAKAQEDLKKLGTREAVVNFYARHDALLDATLAAAPQTVACVAGCSYCCQQFEVVAQPVEVFEIQAHVSRHFKPDQLKGVIERASRNVEMRKAASEQARLTLRPVCPFLVNNSCSIYSVRPSVCRNYHATDRDNCRQSFEDPSRTWTNTYIDDLFFAAMGSSAGFKNAVTEQGLDTRNYHLSGAFLETVRDPKCGKRFKGGKRAFLKATTTDFDGGAA